MKQVNLDQGKNSKRDYVPLVSAGLLVYIPKNDKLIQKTFPNLVCPEIKSHWSRSFLSLFILNNAQDYFQNE